MHASYILVCDIESLENHAVVVMVLWILGSKGPYKISSSQLLMVECVEGNLLWVGPDVPDND